ncbi:MAG: TolB family protein, partial [Acidobacteriota bacterium]
FNEAQGTVSPDGRLMAYASDESGQYEIYVDEFPTPRARARVSVGGGTDPRWRQDGRELYYRRGTAVHAVTLSTTGGRVEAAASTRLFEVEADIRAYDAAPDGARFLINLPAAAQVAPAITVLVHPSALIASPRSNDARR